MGLLSKIKNKISSGYNTIKTAVKNATATVVEKWRGLSKSDKIAVGVGAVVSPVLGLAYKGYSSVKSALQPSNLNNAKNTNVASYRTNPVNNLKSPSTNTILLGVGALALLLF